MQIQPYLFFDGRCEEALDFYQAALGAEITMLMRYKDAPPQPESSSQQGCGPGQMDPEKIMHANVQIGEAQIMASDGMNGGKPAFHCPSPRPARMRPIVSLLPSARAARYRWRWTPRFLRAVLAW